MSLVPNCPSPDMKALLDLVEKVERLKKQKESETREIAKSSDKPTDGVRKILLEKYHGGKSPD